VLEVGIVGNGEERIKMEGENEKQGGDGNGAALDTASLLRR